MTEPTPRDDRPGMNDPRLVRLSRLLRRLSFGLSGAVIVAALGIHMSVVWAPQWLATPVGENTLVSRGIVISLVIIILAVIATGLFVRFANTRLEAMREDILKNPQRSGGDDR